MCAADLYWSKDSFCGGDKSFTLNIIVNFIVSLDNIKFDSIADCTDEYHATTCFALSTDHQYHMVTIRSLTEKEISFDWFLIDNPDLTDLPELRCTFE